MSRDGPARKPIRAPAIPKQCETENVATALSVSSSAGSEANGTSGSMTSEPCVTSWTSSSPCSSARRASAASSSSGLHRAIRVQRVDDDDRARTGRDRGGDDVGIEAVAVARADRHRDRHGAGRDHGRRHVEVAGVRQDDLVARPGHGHQRQRDARLRALGADDLEVLVARAAEHAGRGVAQRLDEVGAVLVEVLGGDRVAHRLDGARRRPGEARQPAEIGPCRGVQARRAAGIQRRRIQPDDADRVAVREVVPHRVVRALERAQPLGRELRGAAGSAPQVRTEALMRPPPARRRGARSA